jgi:hypothetical protein
MRQRLIVPVLATILLLGCGSSSDNFDSNNANSTTQIQVTENNQTEDNNTQSEWVLEDGEDGNTEGWSHYGTSGEAFIYNIYDDIFQSQVIVSDAKFDEGFAFDSFTPIKAKIVSWAILFEKDFRFLIKVHTNNPDHESLYIEYTPDASKAHFDETDGKKYLHLGIGKVAKLGEWIEVERDLENDLKALFPDDTLLAVEGFYIYGSGRLDDLTIKQEGGGFPARSNFFEIARVDVPKPDPNQSFVEPLFGTTITRITNRTNETANAHPYPKSGSSWNCDNSIIKMQYRLYNAKTLKELPLTAGLNQDEAYKIVGSPLNGAGDLRWSKSNPNLLYVLDSSKRFKKVTLNSDQNSTQSEILLDMSSFGFENISIGNSEGNLDYDDEYVVFSARKDEDDTVYVMLFNLKENKLIWTKELQRGKWRDNWSDADSFDWITIDPTGEYILVNAEHKMWLYDRDLGSEFQLAEYGEHGDIGINSDGVPIYIQLIYGGVAIRSYNLQTHEVFDILPSNYGGGHISCRNYKRKGWCYVSTSQEGFREVFALNLDQNSTFKVERFAQSRNSDSGTRYTQVNVSPDGKKVLFASDWGDDGEVLETYQATINHYQLSP